MKRELSIACAGRVVNGVSVVRKPNGGAHVVVRGRTIGGVLPEAGKWIASRLYGGEEESTHRTATAATKALVCDAIRGRR